MADRVDAALEFAAQKLGFGQFKSHQSSALRQFVQGHDLFINLPTGFGKSGIFQAAPVVKDFLNDVVDESKEKALVIVILPLKALAVDQLNSVSQLGLKAADITSDIPDCILEESHNYSILFASPESLFTTKGKELLKLVRSRCHGIFIDESHCVAKWGHSSRESAAFRKVYGQLGELRSTLQQSTSMVALTATATLKVRQTIINSLAMRNFGLIEESPESLNIKFIVLKSPTKNLDNMFTWLATEIVEKGISTDRTIIYCQSRRNVSMLYTLFASLLGEKHHCHFDMYHTNTEADVQKKIINSFAETEGEIRVLFATIAFGLGLNVKNVQTIVMVGHPTELDDVIQLSGRAGRDGTQSVSILIDFPGASAGLKTSDDMKAFLKGDICRRGVIRASFPANKEGRVVHHNCCDICAPLCTCQEGECKMPSPFAELKFRDTLTHGVSTSSEMRVVSVPDDKIQEVTEQLDTLRVSLLTDSSSHLYTGEDISCCFSMDTMKAIITECNIVFPFDKFDDRYTFSRKDVSQAAWNIVKTCVYNYVDSLDSATYSDIDTNSGSSISESDEEDEFGGEYAELGIQYSSESD